MKTVKVYSAPACPYCRMVKEFLSSKNIAYEYIDVSADKAALEEMVKISGQMGVPVVLIDGEAVVGLDKSRLESLLGL